MDDGLESPVVDIQWNLGEDLLVAVYKSGNMKMLTMGETEKASKSFEREQN
jgi:hypothetical protein